MKLIEKIRLSLEKNHARNAFHIAGVTNTYAELIQAISNIRALVEKNVPKQEKLVGLVTNDDLETYAAIIALWFQGKAYIPVNPAIPYTRNQQILKQTKSNFILDSSAIQSLTFDQCDTLSTNSLINSPVHLEPCACEEESYAYILFTSGSTGTPKGVPISFANLNGLINALKEDQHYHLDEYDKCLQMFELTFDFSLATYLPPLLYGACVYTVAKDTIKYFEVFKLLVTHELTVIPLVPSVLDLLQPYFLEIKAPQVKYSIFCGGKLIDSTTKEWQKCVPNSTITNYYGPTECTVFSGFYIYDGVANAKAHQGVISIGKAFKNLDYLLIDKNQQIIEETNTEGELCIAGNQVTEGYWENSEKNEISFLNLRINKKTKRYYKTGDLCFRDETGDYMYLERIDFQIKIGGYRVELGEIEFCASQIIKNKPIIATDFINANNITAIALCIVDSKKADEEILIHYMKENLPAYMIPTTIKYIEALPLNLNGKIDREQLKILIAT